MCLYFRLSTANLLQVIFINFFIVYIFWGIYYFFLILKSRVLSRAQLIFLYNA